VRNHGRRAAVGDHQRSIRGSRTLGQSTLVQELQKTHRPRLCPDTAAVARRGTSCSRLSGSRTKTPTDAGSRTTLSARPPPRLEGPLMEAIYAAAVVLAFIAFGELISIWSKDRIPSLLLALLFFFVFAKIAIVLETIIDDSLLLQIYTILVAPLLFHMGTLIPLRVMLKQWRSVIIAISGMLVAVLLILAVVAPLFGFET